MKYYRADSNRTLSVVNAQIDSILNLTEQPD